MSDKPWWMRVEEQYKAGKLDAEAGKYLFVGVDMADPSAESATVHRAYIEDKQAPTRPVNRRKTGIAALYRRVSPQLDVLLEATGHARREDGDDERQDRANEDQ